MKLIDYVIENDDKIPTIKETGSIYKMNIKESLLDAYCPMGFHCLKNTLFSKPTYPRKDDKSDCKYRYEEDLSVCKLCWEREIL